VIERNGFSLKYKARTFSGLIFLHKISDKDIVHPAYRKVLYSEKSGFSFDAAKGGK
tara:strand:- start:27778 stop:27945 length:168 start_codon:yes stop_codon:yes gene_type:complete